MMSNVSSLTRRTLVNRYPALVVVSMLCLAPAWVRYWQGFATVSGFFSDLLCALLLSVLLLRVQRVVQVAILLLWFLVQLGSFMLLESMSRLPSWQDFHFLTQGEFLSNSLSESSSAPLPYVLILGVGSTLAGVWLSRLGKPLARSSGGVTLVLLLVAILGAHKLGTRFADDTENLYAQFNPLHWLLSDALSFREGGKAVSADYMLKRDLSGTSLLQSQGKVHNVLVIVLEGIPGLYVKVARDHIVPELQEAPVLMPRLSEWANRGMVTPDFIVHNHQTIRGLYALLCSDYDKLTNATPKAYELQNAVGMAEQCLPAQLARAGFTTHFLQGAGLGFMGKDRLMPAIGFQEVHGSEWFTGKPAVKFGWGADDKTFFEGAARYVDALQKNAVNNNVVPAEVAINSPWFLTLLTVGTHQPYAVPKSYAKKFVDRRDAAVAYLDDAVGQFLDTLKKRGVLDNTLVIITSDESHGGDLADWVSTWGLNIVLAPGKHGLPAVNGGRFALMDTSLSVLDYLGLPAHISTNGRSVFRDYKLPREMVSNTAGRLRWLQGNTRYECSSLGMCRQCQANSLIGTAECVDNVTEPYPLLAQKAAWLDASLTRLASNTHTLRFANGERHTIAHAWKDEWMDNLIGAQYLDFPASSRTQVTLRWRALRAPDVGARMKLVLKQSEETITDVVPELPVIGTGEEAEYSFFIDSANARTNFSFHLLAEAPMDIELLDFSVTTDRTSSL